MEVCKDGQIYSEKETEKYSSQQDSVFSEEVMEEQSSDDEPSFKTELDPKTQKKVTRIQIAKFQDKLDLYRLPLETLTLSDQLMLLPDWINKILTTPRVCIQNKFWANLQNFFDEMNVNWESELDVYNLINIIVPSSKAKVDYLTESYVLLIFVLLMRIQYQREPTLQVKIKRCVSLGAKFYLQALDLRKQDEKLKKAWTWKKCAELLLVFGISLLGSWVSNLLWS